jgi:hypothetical protein
MLAATEVEWALLFFFVALPSLYALDTLGLLSHKSFLAFIGGFYAWSALFSPSHILHPSENGVKFPSKTILFPLPSSGFDPSVSVAIQTLQAFGHNVIVATKKGGKPTRAHWADIDGYLGGSLFPARSDVVSAYRKLEIEGVFSSPVSFNEITLSEIDGVVVSDGKREEMTRFLDDDYLQSDIILPLWKARKPFAAIGKGVLLLARTKDGVKSILNGRVTSGLLAPMEIQTEWMHWLFQTLPKLTKDYTRVEDEIKASIGNSGKFVPGPFHILWPFFGFSKEDERFSFVHANENYVSGRFHGDIHVVTRAFADLLHGKDCPTGAFSSVDTGTVVTKTPLSSLSSNISFESQEGNRNKQCCAEVSALENQIKESSAKIQFAKTESERHRKAADERMIEVASLQTKLEKMGDQIQNFSNIQVENKESIVDKSCLEKLAHLKEQMAESAASADAETERLRKITDEKTSEVAVLQKAADERMIEVASLQTKLEKMGDQIQNLSNIQVENKESIVDKSCLDKLAHLKEQMAESAASADAETERLRKITDEKTSEVAVLQTKLKSLSSKIEALSSSEYIDSKKSSSDCKECFDKNYPLLVMNINLNKKSVPFVIWEGQNVKERAIAFINRNGGKYNSPNEFNQVVEQLTKGATERLQKIN